MRPESHRLNLNVETFVLVVADHTDDLARLIVIFHLNRDPLADRILAGKYLAREGFIDHDHVTRLQGLLLRVKAAALQRNPHGLKIISVGDDHAGRKILAWRTLGLALDVQPRS